MLMSMKKFILMMCALVMSTVMFAQTVESSKTFENTYVSVEGGVISPFTSNNGWSNSLRPLVGIEFGKNFTPVVGISVEALGNFNTTGAYTWFDQSNIVGNFKVNLSNWFGGYKDRTIDILVVPGIGWGHNYGEYSLNYLTYNAYGQVDFNLGEQKAWQINIKPGVTWATGLSDVNFDGRRAAATVRIGITYKFGSKTKHSHNFVKCPYSVTAADYAALVTKYNELEKRGPIVKEVEKVVTKVDTVYCTEMESIGQVNLPFSIGSTELTSGNKELINDFIEGIDDNTRIIVTGSADSSTGSQARNEYLAKTRAEVVKNYLISLGFSENRIVTDSVVDFYNDTINSRSVVMYTEDND